MHASRHVGDSIKRFAARIGCENVHIPGQLCGGDAPCRADINCDSFVNGLDLGSLLAAWGACPGQSASCGEAMAGGAASQLTGIDPFLEWALQASIEELFEWYHSTATEPED